MVRARALATDARGSAHACAVPWCGAKSEVRFPALGTCYQSERKTTSLVLAKAVLAVAERT